jgi:hypothetical protein
VGGNPEVTLCYKRYVTFVAFVINVPATLKIED